MPRPNRGAYLKFNKKRSVFYIHWYEDGRLRQRSTCTGDSREAEKELAIFIASKNISPRDPTETLIADMLAYYGEHHAPNTAAPERIGYAISALLPFFGAMKVGDISTQTCKRYAKERNRAVATVRRELTTLRAAINFCYEEGRLLRKVPVWLPEKPEGKDRWLTRKEAAKLLNQARQGRTDTRLYLPLFILIALRTGARKGAILSLRWPQVNFKTQRIDFNDPHAPKTNKRRPIQPISRPLMTFLKLAYERRDSDLGFVIHDKGQRILDIGDANSGSFGRCCKKAGISGVTPHVLRHTCGTWLAQAGVPLFDIGGWLGHSSERTTELYAHHSADHMNKALLSIETRR